jgi:hypothetical protein
MNREPTADALGVHERASATPARSEHLRAAELGSPPSWTLGKLTLRKQQEWFAAIISTPETEPAPVDERSAGRLVRPSATLSSLERIDIYRQGYHARLIECLVDDYPVLQHALGEEAFEALCRAYIAEHPSRGPSLNHFGRHMAAYCRGQSLPWQGFAADLATLEWAIVLCIQAPTVPAIGLEDLRQVAPEEWPGVRFSVNSSLRVLSLEHQANAYLQAYRQGRSAVVPAPRPQLVAVYRTGRSVWRLELEPTLATLLDALQSGVTLEAALSRVQGGLLDKTEQEAAQIVGDCFRYSVSSGLLSAIVTSRGS